MRRTLLSFVSLIVFTATPAFACRSVQSESYLLTKYPPVETPRGATTLRVRINQPDTAFDQMASGQGILATVIAPSRNYHRGKIVLLRLPAWHSCAQIGGSIGYVTGTAQTPRRGRTVITPMLRRDP